MLAGFHANIANPCKSFSVGEIAWCAIGHVQFDVRQHQIVNIHRRQSLASDIFFIMLLVVRIVLQVKVSKKKLLLTPAASRILMILANVFSMANLIRPIAVDSK